MPLLFHGIARGEQWNKAFDLKDGAGADLDLTGRTVTFYLREGDTVHARIVDVGDSTGGSMQVTRGTGRVVVTVDKEVTAAVADAAWSLWLDKDAPTADAVTWGGFCTEDVATDA